MITEDELDHPCKQTCSGWKQGFEKGSKSRDLEASALQSVIQTSVAEVKKLREELISAIKYYDDTLPCGKDCNTSAPHCGEPECAMRRSFRKVLEGK